jgi:hypothetical protein
MLEGSARRERGQMVCEEKHRLVVEYAATAKSLSKAVANSGASPA